MTQPRVFISFDFDNNADQKNLFAGQFRKEDTPFDVSD
jgi:hypothetical protein